MSEYQKLARSIDKHWCEMAAMIMLRRCLERVKEANLPRYAIQDAIRSIKGAKGLL